MRVKLFFRTLRDSALEQKVKGLEIVRLKALVQFRTKEGWTDAYEAIVDTGAPISLIPQSIWKESEFIQIADHEVMGVVPKPECSLPVKIGKLTCVVLDFDRNQTKESEIYAFLAATDKVSLIMGFKDLLSEFSLHSNYRSKEAYIEG